MKKAGADLKQVEGEDGHCHDDDGDDDDDGDGDGDDVDDDGDDDGLTHVDCDLGEVRSSFPTIFSIQALSHPVTSRLHFKYISNTFWFHFGYISVTFQIHFKYILVPFRLHLGYISNTF